MAQNFAEDILREKRLVFLVGAPRSGTTWLQLMLSRSPSIVSAQETDLFNIYLRPMITDWNRCRSEGVRIGLSEVLSDDQFLALLRSVCGFVLARIAERRPSATVVLEKTPNHVTHWREILELWPDAHFIHLIRDPRSVVASRRAAAKNWGPEWGSADISTLAEMWCSFVSDGLKIRRATPNYQQVKYEELISDGPRTLLRLLQNLGVPSDLEECRRYVDDCAMEKLRAGKLDSAPFDMAGSVKYRFRIGKTDSWRVELSGWEIAIVEHISGPLMKELGYQPTTDTRAMELVMKMASKARNTAKRATRKLLRFTERRGLV